MLVMKFGGTSVGSAIRMKEVACLIEAQKQDVIVVLSAISGTTNELLQVADYLRANNPAAATEIINKLELKYRHECKELGIEYVP